MPAMDYKKGASFEAPFFIYRYNTSRPYDNL